MTKLLRLRALILLCRALEDDFLQGGGHIVLIVADQVLHRFHNGIMQQLLSYGRGGAADSGTIFQAIDASPHNFLSAMDAPGNPSVQAAADAAHQSLR